MSATGPSHGRWLVILLLAVVVTRIPLLFVGYSFDSDAWRVAAVGKTFWETGNYEVSRFPGYPLHEIITGPFVLFGGSFLSNISTLIAALILIVVWNRFVQKESKSPRILTLLLAFTPLFWIDSSETSDYVWSLLFILLCLSAVRINRVALGGLLLGCAIGFRPTNVIVVAPLLFLQYYLNTPKKVILTFILCAMGTSLLAFSPVFITYGFSGWIHLTLAQTSDIHHPIWERSRLFVYRLVYSIGLLAFVAIGTVLLSRRNILRALLREREPLVTAAIVGVVVFVLLLAIFPLERSYLLPAFPFLYLLVDRIASAKALTAITCCVISFAFINPDVVIHKQQMGTPGFNVHAGTVIENWQRRDEMIKEQRTIATLSVDTPAVVMTGRAETFWFENELIEPDTLVCWTRINREFVHSKTNPGVHFIVGLTKEDVSALQADGFAVYCLASITGLLEQKHGYTVSGMRVGVITF